MADLAYIQIRVESSGPCPTCGVDVTMPSALLAKKRENGTIFYCINGHSQSFNLSTVDKLRKELEEQKKATDRARLELEVARNMRDTARKAEAIARGKLKAQSQRIKHGVCPCCHRTVRQLAAHMQMKHPEWTGEAP